MRQKEEGKQVRDKEPDFIENPDIVVYGFS